MSDRDDILGRLHLSRRHAKAPAPWRSRRQFQDLAQRFTTALEAGAGEVRRAADLSSALDQLGEVLKELGARRVAVNHDAPLVDLDLAARWPEVDWFRVNPSMSGSSQEGGAIRDFCATADVGLTGADAALAETGTIVLSSGLGRSRVVPLLPPVHVALVATSCLTMDIFTWAAMRSGVMPSAVTLVSGPSKTADIEQTLAIGVHGPGRLIVILYDDISVP